MIRGFDSWQGKEVFLFSEMSRLVLWLTVPPVQWVPEVLGLTMPPVQWVPEVLGLTVPPVQWVPEVFFFLVTVWPVCEADHLTSI